MRLPGYLFLTLNLLAWMICEASHPCILSLAEREASYVYSSYWACGMDDLQRKSSVTYERVF